MSTTPHSHRRLCIPELDQTCRYFMLASSAYLHAHQYDNTPHALIISTLLTAARQIVLQLEHLLELPEEPR